MEKTDVKHCRIKIEKACSLMCVQGERRQVVGIKDGKTRDASEVFNVSK